jgi:hypothetical protein
LKRRVAGSCQRGTGADIELAWTPSLWFKLLSGRPCAKKRSITVPSRPPLPPFTRETAIEKVPRMPGIAATLPASRLPIPKTAAGETARNFFRGARPSSSSLPANGQTNLNKIALIASGYCFGAVKWPYMPSSQSSGWRIWINVFLSKSIPSATGSNGKPSLWRSRYSGMFSSGWSNPPHQN